MNTNKIRLVALLSVFAGLTACDDEAYRPPAEPAAPVEMAEPEPLPTEPAPPPAPAQPVDQSQLPPPPQNSEETVQPESETLFY